MVFILFYKRVLYDTIFLTLSLTITLLLNEINVGTTH